MNAAKLNRDQKRERRVLAKAFDNAWKREAKLAGWGYLKPTSFKLIGDWFVAINPTISTERFASDISATVKPFLIDDLMSRLMGFDGLDGKPLSLRARGPHCLVVPMFRCSIEEEGDLPDMVKTALEFLNSIPSRIAATTLEDFIAIAAPPSGQVSANQVAALILGGREQEAADLCKDAIAKKQWGGPGRITEDGKVITFFQLALRWIGDRSADTRQL
jgi:hypothetical protein